MNLLIDTHVALWMYSSPERLGPSTRTALVGRGNFVYVSAVSVWEVEIKRAIGKLVAPSGFAELCRSRGFDELPITFEHAEAAGQLPAHHHDPFDRMLIGQAVVEDLRVVTADSVFASYGIATFDPSM